MTQKSKRRSPSILKLLMVLCGVAVLGVVAYQVNLQGVIQAALEWSDRLGAWGAIAFIGIYSLATVLLIPGSLLTLGGGALFGVVLGSVYVFVGATMGATLAFLIGRYVARDWVARRLAGNPKFKAIEAAIAQEGFKIVLLTRLSPVFPFTLLNYALGITPVSLKDYGLGFIGMIPGTITYVYIGSLAGGLARLGNQQSVNPDAQRLQSIFWIVGLVVTLAGSIYVTRIARKALDQQVSSGDTDHADYAD